MACCLVQKVWKIEEKEEAENIFVQLLKDKVKRGLITIQEIIRRERKKDKSFGKTKEILGIFLWVQLELIDMTAFLSFLTIM